MRSASLPSMPPDLLDALVAATSFEEAAHAVLRAMVELAEATLRPTRFARGGRIVRAVAHVRPGDAYRGIALLEASAPELSGSRELASRLTSTTAWRWLQMTRHAVSIDVHVGKIESWSAAKGEPLSGTGPAPADFDGSETRLGLMARDVTHVHALPLRWPSCAVSGMISLEAACRSSIGVAGLWRECARDLQAIADLAAPYLANLPTAPVESPDVDPLLPVVGHSMSGVVEILRTFAQQDEPLLITGPTGAGKSRLARWVHERSPRSGRPFEVLDLCAVPESLQMAELFGWKKGAFTGAVRDKPGYVALARGGTIFIDEIDNLGPNAQAGLLHLLEEQTYRALGDDGREVAADVRFVIGTNSHLQNAVRERRFRQDLYYRINVLPIRLPPLKERSDEIGPWARYMATRRHELTVPDGSISITASAEEFLGTQEWPGNLRQLDNIVRRAYALAAASRGGPPPRTMLLDEPHFRRAMAYESPEENRSVVDAMMAAATAFVEEASARGRDGLDLDLTDAFKGFVLGVATERSAGSRDEAFRLLGRQKLAKGRNHYKVLRREIERVAEFCRALGEAPAPFADLVTPSEPDSPPDSMSSGQ